MLCLYIVKVFYRYLWRAITFFIRITWNCWRMGCGLSCCSSPFEAENTICGQAKVYLIKNEGETISYQSALSLMQKDKRFQDFLTNTVKDCGCDAFVWETVPVTDSCQDQIDFVFAITESRPLDSMRKDTETFAEHFNNSTEKFVASFPNIGRDAALISPLPYKWFLGEKDYTHFGKFLRAAPRDQIRAFWSEVARVMEKQLSSEDRPFWLSTAGHGVGWLHMRVDTVPKYYSHLPFKEFVEPISSKYSQSNKSKYTTRENFEDHGRLLIYDFAYESKPIMFKEALLRLQQDKTFRELMTDTFVTTQHTTPYVWETIPVSQNTMLKTEFKFVLVRDDNCNEELARDDNSNTEPKDEVVSITEEETTQDILVIPPSVFKQHSTVDCISELFPNASDEILQDFWKKIGEMMSQKLKENGKQPVWLSSYAGQHKKQPLARISSRSDGCRYKPYQKFNNKM